MAEPPFIPHHEHAVLSFVKRLAQSKHPSRKPNPPVDDLIDDLSKTMTWDFDSKNNLVSQPLSKDAALSLVARIQKHLRDVLVTVEQRGKTYQIQFREEHISALTSRGFDYGRFSRQSPQTKNSDFQLS